MHFPDYKRLKKIGWKYRNPNDKLKSDDRGEKLKEFLLVACERQLDFAFIAKQSTAFRKLNDLVN